MAADSHYSQILRRLVESDEWEAIFGPLAAKLNEVGWVDELKHTAKERAREMPTVHFQTLLAELEAKGQESVPAAVKQETMQLIRTFLDKQFE
ncbi:hypothetical protein SCHPADRAFT_822530 [Schizopora paradoxa]|uniref:Transcription and mRNA export factor SUS1 n=1 Tax=Schizopora paradoxa TaxID=27342 RepID=A0A0H2RYX5_9AGAM|nr:hypothetical protein SCHPADRAFT_822530 [Schizopora paradoxa]